MRGPAFFAYSDNYLIDVKCGVILGAKSSRAIRQAEVGASQTMIERTEQRFGLKPKWLAGDTAYGSGKNLNWLVNDKDIAPHIPVIDKSKREDGTFSREDFTFDKERNVYICPANKTLTTTGTVVDDGETLRYHASTSDCRGCVLKVQCCPKASFRRIPRSIYEEARDVARALAKTKAFEQSCRERKRIEMLFAHLKRILRLASPSTTWPARLPVRVHAGSYRPEPSSARQTGCSTTTSSRRVRRIVVVGTGATASKSSLPKEQAQASSSRNLFSRHNSYNRRLLQQNLPEADVLRNCCGRLPICPSARFETQSGTRPEVVRPAGCGDQ